MKHGRWNDLGPTSRRRREAASAGAAAMLGLAVLGGCAGVLGIPSDLELSAAAEEAGADAGPDTAPLPDASMVDAATIDASPDVDAAPPPPHCDPAKDFDAPVPLVSINTAEEDGAARLSEDELTIYLDGVRSALAPSFGIFFATRLALTDSFGPVQQFPSVDNSIDTADDEYAPNVTADGLTLVFERKNLATQNSDIYAATRASKSAPFGTVSSVANLNTPDYEANPFVRGDATQLWHVRKPTGVDIDIALATLTPGAGYVITVPAGLNSTSFDVSPVISRDGLTMYFASERPPGAPGNRNIWSATRPTRTAGFSPPVLVAGVNSDSNEYPGFVSGDGCRLYLVSERPGGLGGQDVYVATRPK